MEYCIRSMGILELSAFQTQTGQGLRKIGDPPQHIVFSWKSKKQSVFSQSSAKSEYQAMIQFVCEIMWISQLLMEVGIETSVPTNLTFHERTKHIEIDCHFVCEKIKLGLISIRYVKTGEQLGDIFTKLLSGDQVNYLCNKLGMINIYAPT